MTLRSPEHRSTTVTEPGWASDTERSPSTSLVEMVMTLKDHFQVAVVATEFDQMKTVADLVTYLDRKVRATEKAK